MNLRRSSPRHSNITNPTTPRTTTPSRPDPATLRFLPIWRWWARRRGSVGRRGAADPVATRVGAVRPGAPPAAATAVRAAGRLGPWPRRGGGRGPLRGMGWAGIGAGGTPGMCRRVGARRNEHPSRWAPSVSRGRTSAEAAPEYPDDDQPRHQVGSDLT